MFEIVDDFHLLSAAFRILHFINERYGTIPSIIIARKGDQLIHKTLVTPSRSGDEDDLSRFDRLHAYILTSETKPAMNTSTNTEVIHLIERTAHHERPVRSSLTLLRAQRWWYGKTPASMEQCFDSPAIERCPLSR
jgi:hypothetical protein